MRQGITENMGNCLVVGILIYLCWMAIRSIWRSRKNGLCVGCSKGSCSSCTSGRNIVAEARKAYNEDRKRAQSVR